MNTKQERFEVNWEEDCIAFATYKGAFNLYMKLRDDCKWIYVIDLKTGDYLIRENC